jgi:hypothetical protein
MVHRSGISNLKSAVEARSPIKRGLKQVGLARRLRAAGVEGSSPTKRGLRLVQLDVGENGVASLKRVPR